MSQNIVEYRETGGIDVIEYKQAPIPTISDDEVLVKNAFAGINFIDTYFRTGLYKDEFPIKPGKEGSGTVEKVGKNISKFKKGDRVVYMTNKGAYAQYTAVDPKRTVKLPDSVTFESAAAALLTGLTALSLVLESYEAKSGEWVLVHAAAGATGRILVQLLKNIGSRVIATASTPEKREHARQLGAEVVLDYSEVVDEIPKITNGKGVAAVYDGVGKATFEDDLKVVANKGSVLSFGNASGAVELGSILVLGPKSIRLMRPTLFSYITTEDEFHDYVEKLLKHLADKTVTVEYEVYDLKEAAKAQAALEGRKTTGKLLLKP